MVSSKTSVSILSLKDDFSKRSVFFRYDKSNLDILGQSF